MQEAPAKYAGNKPCLYPCFPGLWEHLYPEDQSRTLLQGKACQPRPDLCGSMLSHASTIPSPPLPSLLLWGALLCSGSLPDWAWGTETFTLGVLGPWDSIFAQARPSVAA